MNGLPQTTPIAPEPAAPPREPSAKRWPAWYAFVTAWLYPTSTTARMAHVPLWQAFAVHAGAALATLLVVIAFDYAQSGYNLSFAEYVAVSMVSLAGGGLGSDAATWQSLLLLGVIALSVEAGVIAAALLVMPCGAAREPIGDSIRHALRRVWLHTPVALVIVLVSSMADRPFQNARSAYHNRAEDDCDAQYPQPVYSPSATFTSAQQEAWQKRWECIERHPSRLIAAVIEAAHVLSMGLLVALAIWSLLRGVQAERSYREAAYPSTCRPCGYNLTGTGFEGRCPECGIPVADSLGEDSDPGSPWDRRPELGRVRGLTDTLALGLLRPRQLAAQLRVIPPRGGWMTVLIWTAVLVGLTPGGVAWMSESLVFLGIGIADVLRALTFCAAFGAFLAGVALLVVGLAASLAGAAAGMKVKRNVFRGTAQLAAYMSGHLVLTAWLVGLCIVAMIRWEDEIGELGRALGWSPWSLSITLVLGIVGLTIASLIAYLVRVYRASRALWYARR